MSNTEDSSDSLKFLESTRSFLGREFLTWIWFKSETLNHTIQVGQLGRFKIYIDDKMILSSSSGSVRENSLKGGTPAYAHEAATALRSGKMLQEAKFILQTQEQQWMFQLSAEHLNLKNIKLPPIIEKESQAYFTQRIAYTQLLNDVIEGLFKEYMDLRMTTLFEQESKKMREWMDQKVFSN